MMEQYIDKSAVVAEINSMLKSVEHTSHCDEASFNSGRWKALTSIKKFLDTLEVKEINTWHLQKNEDINDAVKDWGLHLFACLMDDGTIQKFTGILCECADGSINRHIGTIDDRYDTNNIIFWIETPL